MNWHNPADVARLDQMRDRALSAPHRSGERYLFYADYRAALIDADPLARIRELEAENAALRETNARNIGLLDALEEEGVRREAAEQREKRALDDLAALKAENARLRDANESVAVCAEHTEDVTYRDERPCLVCALQSAEADLAALRERHQRALVVIRRVEGFYAGTPGNHAPSPSDLRAILDAEQEAERG